MARSATGGKQQTEQNTGGRCQCKFKSTSGWARNDLIKRGVNTGTDPGQLQRQRIGNCGFQTGLIPLQFSLVDIVAEAISR